MLILTINNRNFQKPSGNPSNRTKVKILAKKIFGQLIKKIWFCVCSVTAEMLEHRNSGENRRKRSEIMFENLRRAYKDLIQVKKKFQIISCLCTFNELQVVGMRGLKRTPFCHFFSLLAELNTLKSLFFQKIKLSPPTIQNLVLFFIA